MQDLNLNLLATSLIQDKWMLSHINYVNLVAQVNTLMANPSIDVVEPVDTFVPDNNVEGDTVAIINVSGILAKGVSPIAEKLLGLVNTNFIAESLDNALEDTNVKAVLLIFNSPGGSTAGIEELGRKIARVDAVKPVFGWVEQQASSAAYWLLSQCRKIAMAPSSSVGSVGVYAVIDDLSGSLKQAGISKQAIFSGKYKLLGASFKPLTDEEKEILQADVTKTHQQFKDVILSKRDVDPKYLEGMSYTGDTALEAGLVDYLCDYLDEFMTEIVNQPTTNNQQY